jgi:hypothetical protein
MAKKPKSGKCVHCLRDPVERNWDHVFPVSWYPASTEPNTERWQIPSCIPCNDKYGKIESDFLIRVGLCLDPYDPASADIVRKALRALDPAAARNPRDQKLRAARRAKMLTEVWTGDAIPTEATIPGMEERWGTPRLQQTGIPIPAEYIRLLVEKVVRGIFYVEDGRFIEPPFAIEHWVLPYDASAAWKNELNRYGQIYKREPGVTVHRAIAEDDKHSSLFEIVFWKQFKMHASVTNGGFVPSK